MYGRETPASLALLDEGGRLLAIGPELQRRLGQAGVLALCRGVAQAARGPGAEVRFEAPLEVEGRSLEASAERLGGYLLVRLEEGGGAARPERSEAFARLAEGMAHDARNPLNTLSIHLGLLTDRLEGGDPEVAARLSRHLRAMREQIGRIEGVLRCFMRFASPAPGTAGGVDLGELVSQAVRACGHDARRHGVSLAAQVEEARVEGDPGGLGEVILNLVMGGIDQGGQGSELQISLARDGAEAVLDLVGDAGAGPDGRGPGVGAAHAERLLLLAERIVELHRGQLSASREGRSRRVEVRLPLAHS